MYKCLAETSVSTLGGMFARVPRAVVPSSIPLWPLSQDQLINGLASPFATLFPLHCDPVIPATQCSVSSLILAQLWYSLEVSFTSMGAKGCRLFWVH